MVEKIQKISKNSSDLPDVLRTLEQLEKDVVETLLQPNKYGLINRDGWLKRWLRGIDEF